MKSQSNKISDAAPGACAPRPPRKRTPKILALDHADGFRTEWRSGPNGHRTVWVDVFKDGNLVMEWEYGAVCGRSLLKNANLWTAQAILQAKDEMGAAT